MNAKKLFVKNDKRNKKKDNKILPKIKNNIYYKPFIKRMKNLGKKVNENDLNASSNLINTYNPNLFSKKISTRKDYKISKLLEKGIIEQNKNNFIFQFY